MSQHPTHKMVRRGSVQEAIEKITGVRSSATGSVGDGKPAADKSAYGEKQR